MRRSINLESHALQPEEYLELIEKAIRYIANQKGLTIPETDSSEKRLELILRYVIRSGIALGVTKPNIINTAGIPVDDKIPD